MKSSIRRYCNEGHDVVSAIDMLVARSERPVQGTTASVCAMNETQKTLEVHKIEGSSKYHDEEIRSEPEAVGEESHEKYETGRSPQCSDLQTGWALHKPRNEAVRFPTEVKHNLTTKFDLGERTGIKSDPAKVAVLGCLRGNIGSQRVKYRDFFRG